MKKHLRRVWKGMMVGVVVGLIGGVGFQILNTTWVSTGNNFIEKVWAGLFDPVFFGFQGGIMGLIFGSIFLLIPETAGKTIRIVIRLVIVGGFLSAVTVWSLDTNHIREWVDPARYWLWGPVLLAYFLILLFGVFLFDRIHVWTPKFLSDKPGPDPVKGGN